MLARQHPQLVLVLIVFQTDHTLDWIVLLQFGPVKDFDGQVAHHLCRRQIRHLLLVQAHAPHKVEEQHHKGGRQDNKYDHVQHWPIEMRQQYASKKGYNRGHPNVLLKIRSTGLNSGVRVAQFSYHCMSSGVNLTRYSLPSSMPRYRSSR